MVPILAFVMRGSKVGERSLAKSGPSLVIHRYTVVWCFPLGPLIIEFQQFREGERVRVEIKLLYVNAFDNFLFLFCFTMTISGLSTGRAYLVSQSLPRSPPPPPVCTKVVQDNGREGKPLYFSQPDCKRKNKRIKAIL